MTQSLALSETQSSRRRFLLCSSASALFTASGWPSTSVAQANVEQLFLEFSETLVGHQSLDDDIATRMLSAFRAIGKEDAIAALLNGEPDVGLENAIASAWYSGLSPDPDAKDVLSYTDALMWDAMTYTKPMGYCGGGMGYWAEPPAA